VIALPAEQAAFGCNTYPCWLCGKPLGPVAAVVWCGADGVTIQLHPSCSGALGSHLIADSREAQLASGGGVWTRRAARVAGAALRAAELQETPL
jgi:hypothetical protein